MGNFGSLLADQIPRLRRYARILTEDRELADDLVQDCLERALVKQSLWREGSDLRAWLFTLMHNLFVNDVRARARRPVADPIDESEIAGTSSDGAVARSDMRALERALAELGAESREVLLLVALEGLPYGEAARVLGVPVGTVMSRLSRAREQLRKSLEQGGRPVLRRVR